MNGLEALPFLRERGHVVSLVGGGGKTTLLYGMARLCAAEGQRVLVSTTTHILRRNACYAPMRPCGMPSGGPGSMPWRVRPPKTAS